MACTFENSSSTLNDVSLQHQFMFSAQDSQVYVDMQGSPTNHPEVSWLISMPQDIALVLCFKTQLVNIRLRRRSCGNDLLGI